MDCEVVVAVSARGSCFLGEYFKFFAYDFMSPTV